MLRKKSLFWVIVFLSLSAVLVFASAYRAYEGEFSNGDLSLFVSSRNVYPTSAFIASGHSLYLEITPKKNGTLTDRAAVLFDGVWYPFGESNNILILLENERINLEFILFYETRSFFGKDRKRKSISLCTFIGNTLPLPHGITPLWVEKNNHPQQNVNQLVESYLDSL